MRRGLGRFIVRRGLAAAGLVFLVASAALLIARLAPGDYASQFARDPQQAAAERHRLGLDRPWAEQYRRWAGRAITLDFGDSFMYRRPVRSLVAERALNTALLAGVALLVATTLGIAAGMVTGSRPDGALSTAVRAASAILLSIPPLISSLLLMFLAARTGWFPVGGFDAPPPGADWWTIVAGAARHVVLPALALAMPLAAMLERVQSQALDEALETPPVRAARSRGIPRARIVGRHAWKLSLGPVLAVYSLVASSLFSGSFAVEVVTGWPGLGNLMVQALVARDTYLVAGCAAAGACFLAIAVFATDIAHALVDPRLGAWSGT